MSKKDDGIKLKHKYYCRFSFFGDIFGSKAMWGTRRRTLLQIYPDRKYVLAVGLYREG